jgi:DNA-binding response OmpR family regulator
VPVRSRILIVDDDPLVAGLIADILNEYGYSAATTTTVTSAVRELRDNEFAAILLDCLLPNGNCTEVIRAAEAREVPVVLMSGDPTQIDTTTGFPFLAKPFSIEELERTLRSVLTPASHTDQLGGCGD